MPVVIVGSVALDTVSTSAEEHTDLLGGSATCAAGQIIQPRFPRALFGLEELSEQLDDEAIRADFDLGPVRRAVTGWRVSMEGRQRSLAWVAT